MHFVAALDRVPVMHCVLGRLEAARTDSTKGFGDLLTHSLRRSGPFLIELPIRTPRGRCSKDMGSPITA
ncbi:MAG: hypothetical protein ABSC06_12050 [Rhodopila sp.]|jgi:hypothetical protein